MTSVVTWLSDRHGGVSLPPFNSLNLGLHVGDDDAAVGATLDDLVVANQVHGARVTVVGEEHRGRGATDLESAIPQTDALICERPSMVIAILVADCVPVAVIDDNGGRVGLAHAGWRGIAAGVLEATVTAMLERGSLMSHLRCEVGPGISSARFEVGEEVIAQLGLGADSPHVDRTRLRPHVDLTGVVLDRLVGLGLERSVISVSDERTGDRYFSARSGEQTGRFAMLAKILDNGG
jgi:YfiH family protein